MIQVKRYRLILFTTWEQTTSGELFLFQDSKKFVLNERGEVIVDTTGPE
jgi:hypothetical protein